MLDLAGNWAVQGQTYAIIFGSSLPNNIFHGYYVGINDPSQFVAQVFSSPRGTVVSMVQTHQGANYFAAYSLRLSAFNTLQGSYADVESNLVSFELVREVPKIPLPVQQAEGE